MASQIIENYLKALYALSLEDERISPSDIARQLSVSLPTVNSMVKKLARMGLVHYEKYKPLRITEEGRREAALIVRKHRLTEMYLVEKMGFGWEEVHSIAEQIEHIQSPAFFDRIDILLEYPKVDPHGSPIPDKDGHTEIPNYGRLSDCQAGDTVCLKALDDSSEAFLKHLNRKELVLGLDLKVLSKDNFDRSLSVRYSEHKRVTLSEKVCYNLFIEKHEA